MHKEKLWDLKEQLESSHHLIHCITNPISINDCANAILAIGAKPIMAQHPKECVQITSNSNALALNIGNFDDIRAASMKDSAAYAKAHHIPITFDAVGVGCSDMRLAYANEFITAYHPDIIKGNLSEWKALANKPSYALGIDVGENDIEDVKLSSIWLKKLAQKWNCTIVCSGKIDIITDGDKTYHIYNGHELLSRCTGTGCMLNVLCASYTSISDPLSAAVFATTLLGIAAEKSYEYAKTPGQFHIALFDWLYALAKADIKQLEKIEETNYEDRY